MAALLSKLNLDPRNMVEKAIVHYLKESDNDVKLIITSEDQSHVLLELVKTESGVMKVTDGDSNKTDVISSDHEHSVTDIIGLETRLVSIETLLSSVVTDVEELTATVSAQQPW